MQLTYPLKPKHAARILIALVIIELILCAIYFTDFMLGEPIWRIHEWFNLDHEATFPTWFSVIQLFMIGLLALATAHSKNYVAPPSKRGLTIFGLGFIFLSLDEGASIHEKITWVFHNNPLVPYFDGVHGIWIVVYGGIGLIVLAILHRDIIAIIKNFRFESIVFIVGMIIYLAGAGGAETITYFFLDKTNQFAYTIEVILEEFLEMAGASILLYSVLLASIKKTGPKKIN